ncbi:hypothetical protein B296_00020981 [Ensete ventricosum]|uniref:Uncharacterized protein n=1 Tax=Ensete ventricosum TaxID=4639 RepID=A0A426XQ99_ENSVE|nr:hypothetical protein B296_00020981 [Ensete ventricosum]
MVQDQVLFNSTYSRCRPQVFMPSAIDDEIEVQGGCGLGPWAIHGIGDGSPESKGDRVEARGGPEKAVEDEAEV